MCDVSRFPKRLVGDLVFKLLLRFILGSRRLHKIRIPIAAMFDPLNRILKNCLLLSIS